MNTDEETETTPALSLIRDLTGKLANEYNDHIGNDSTDMQKQRANWRKELSKAWELRRQEISNAKALNYPNYNNPPLPTGGTPRFTRAKKDSGPF